MSNKDIIDLLFETPERIGEKIKEKLEEFWWVVIIVIVLLFLLSLDFTPNMEKVGGLFDTLSKII
jgi:hypothetical protein